MVDRTVRLAQLFAARLAEVGFDVLNDVVLNQVLVSFGSADETRRIVETVADEGIMFAGPTVWQGQTAMRVSVSGHSTSEDDIEQSVDAIVRAARTG